MLINLRNALMTGKRLPYDAEVEYLESTGTQWIDTGVVWESVTTAKIEATVQYTQTSGRQIACGAGTAFYFGCNANRWEWAYNRYTGTVGTGVTTVAKEVTSAETKFYIDGSVAAALTASASQAWWGSSAYAFGLNNGGTFILPSTARLYSLKIWIGDSLVFDGIPVRRGTVGYLYDRVSGKLFGNAGTGDFVLGPDVVPVEYIESHGTEYVDTGITADGNTVAEFAFAMTNTANAYASIFGSRSGWKSRAFVLFRDTATSGCASFSVGAQGLISTYSLRTIAWHTVRIGRQWTFDDYSGNFGNVGTFTTPTTLKLFGFHWTGGDGVKDAASMQCSYLRIYSEDTLTRSFRPVRVGTDATSWEGAMMDVLTRRIYRNAGTGAFTYGNDLKYPIPSE